MTLLNIAQYGFSIIQIETMAVCNMKCEFCAYPLRLDKKAVLSDKIVFRILDSLSPDDSFECVCFSQFNEPLLDNRIFNFIAYAKSLKLPVLIVTNGLLFRSEEIIQKLVKANPDLVKISLQTINSDSYRDARKVNSSFVDYKKRDF